MADLKLCSILDVIEKLPKDEKVRATVHFRKGKRKGKVETRVKNYDGVALYVYDKQCSKVGRKYSDFHFIDKVIVKERDRPSKKD